MAKLSKKDVQHVADLAQLTLTDAEINRFLPQLEKIVEYVGQLDEVDVSGLLPTSQTTGLVNVQRQDVIMPSSINSDEALSGKDDTYNGFFKVKAILTERSDK